MLKSFFIDFIMDYFLSRELYRAQSHFYWHLLGFEKSIPLKGGLAYKCDFYARMGFIGLGGSLNRMLNKLLFKRNKNGT